MICERDVILDNDGKISVFINALMVHLIEYFATSSMNYLILRR
jgi:hypothetical protein